MNELYKKTAIEVVNLLKSKTISPLEVVEHAISRIEAIDQHVNALPIRCFERAIKQAKSLNHLPTNPDKYLLIEVRGQGGFVTNMLRCFGF